LSGLASTTKGCSDAPDATDQPDRSQNGLTWYHSDRLFDDYLGTHWLPLVHFIPNPGSLRAEPSAPRSDPEHPSNPLNPNTPSSVVPALSGPLNAS
jgi:hypothetical protein